MKTKERRNIVQTKPKKQLGQFATIDEFISFKTEQANKMLSKIKNLDIINS